MNTIGSVKEDLNIEKRISITIETVKKFSSLGFTINIEKNYAKHLGIGDEEYQRAGAILNNSKKEVFEKSDIILNVKCPLADDIDLIKNKSILIGQFDTSNDKDIINDAVKSKKYELYK